MRAGLLAAGLWAMASGAHGCHTALLLAFDVSNSIDAGEYRLQAEGLSEALRDPELSEELVLGSVALSVVQWSGQGQQRVSIPWTVMYSPVDVLAFAAAAETMPRAFVGSNTAVGGIIDFSLNYLASAPPCTRQVIDISGDGQDNAGTSPQMARRAAERAGVQINGLAIESSGLAITSYFLNHVRTRDGFVMTARGYLDYARTLKAKMKREIARVLF